MKRTLKKFYLKFSYNPLDQQKCSAIVDVVVVVFFFGTFILNRDVETGKEY